MRPSASGIALRQAQRATLAGTHHELDTAKTQLATMPTNRRTPKMIT